MTLNTEQHSVNVGRMRVRVCTHSCTDAFLGTILVDCYSKYV